MMAITKKWKITRVGSDKETGTFLYCWWEWYDGAVTVKNRIKISQQTKHRIIIWFNNSTPMYIPKRAGRMDWNR